MATFARLRVLPFAFILAPPGAMPQYRRRPSPRRLSDDFRVCRGNFE